jgi:hypothetical protein
MRVRRSTSASSQACGRSARATVDSLSRVQRVRLAWTSLVNGDSVLWPATLTGAVVAAISIIVGTHRGDIQVDIAMVSMAAFLFGVLLAFTIVRMRDRLASVQELVAKGNAGLFSIHQLAALFHPHDRDRIRSLIDEHLTDQIDYRLVDYHRATPTYLKLIEAVRDLNPVSPQHQAVFRELIVMSVDLDSYRALIEATTGQEMSALEWTSLLLLLLVLLGLISVLPGGTILGALVVGTLAIALATLMILLRKLDVLRWHERVTIWEPTSRLFRSMGHDPYVPRLVIEKGRFLPAGRIRVVDYPDPYPDRSRKVVTLEEHDGRGSVIRARLE